MTLHGESKVRTCEDADKELDALQEKLKHSAYTAVVDQLRAEKASHAALVKKLAQIYNVDCSTALRAAITRIAALEARLAEGSKRHEAALREISDLQTQIVTLNNSWEHGMMVKFQKRDQELTEKVAALEAERDAWQRRALTELRQQVEDTIMGAQKDEDSDGWITAYHFKTGAIHRLPAVARCSGSAALASPAPPLPSLDGLRDLARREAVDVQPATGMRGLSYNCLACDSRANETSSYCDVHDPEKE
jgi:hypothetical protein